MVYLETVGEIGGIEVEITVEGEPESEAEKIHSDLVGRADELRQILYENIHPDATEPPIRVKWEDVYHERQA